MSENLNRANSREFGVTAGKKIARILCTFLISNKAGQVICAKLFEVFYAPRMHSSDGRDTGPKQDMGISGETSREEETRWVWGGYIWGSQKHQKGFKCLKSWKKK